MTLTAQQVHDATFDLSRHRRRSYDRSQVDKFLAKAERALLGIERMTPLDIERASFAKPRIGARGYDEQQVDAFLDQIEAELVARAEEPTQDSTNDT